MINIKCEEIKKNKQLIRVPVSLEPTQDVHSMFAG